MCINRSLERGEKEGDDLRISLSRSTSETSLPRVCGGTCYHIENGSVDEFAFRSLCRRPYYGRLAVLEDEVRANGFIIDWDQSIMISDRGGPDLRRGGWRRVSLDRNLA